MYLTFKRDIDAQVSIIAVLERDTPKLKERLQGNSRYLTFTAQQMHIQNFLTVASGVKESLSIRIDCITRLYERRLMRKERQELLGLIAELQPRLNAVTTTLTELLEEAKQMGNKINRSLYEEQPVSIQTSAAKSSPSARQYK